MKVPDSDWRVTLVRGSTPPLERQQVEVEGHQTAADAERAALSLVDGEDWRAKESIPLCDFCKPAMHDRVEAYTEIIVVDPADVTDEPLGSDAPQRQAQVCFEHFEVARDLPTYRAADEAGDSKTEEGEA